ncbi:hypothetical protein HU200_062588 [Digitaria exilis]|uniref:CBS domain-containing protein n=1 Tax=Digitaria exilis TaxID=1010633 RepID=A0A835DVV7_9POAL|nr:hypothetical protein HU200_062588 [Digitaria exilis]
MEDGGGSPRPPRRPEREGSYNYDIESMDGSGAGGVPPWRSQQNGSSEALLRFDDGGSTGEPLLRKRTMNTTSQIAIVGANVCPIESLDYEYLKAFFVYGGCNVVLAASAAAICAYIAPAAAGSGIPEVKAYLNGVDAYSILAPSTLFVKIFGSVLGVSAGFVLGKEGPMVHTGACIANLLGQGGSRKYHLTCNWLRYFKNDRDRRDLITCGSAAGVAAAFQLSMSIPLSIVDLVFTKVILRRDSIFIILSVCRRGAPFKILLTVTISIITSMCSYGLPWLAACTKCPVDAVEQCPTVGRSGNYKNFQCPPGYYNDLASLFFNTNDDAIRNLFSNGTVNEFRMSSLFIFFTAIYCLGLVTYGIAVPSGLFIPVILAGATYGRIVGTLLGSISDLDPGLFALLGAASFLGGTMRMTVSVCVILLELTNDLPMLPLVMLVLLISKTIADNFNKGVYDQIVVMKGLPYMEAHAEPYMRHLVAGDVVSGPLITFSGVEKVGNIVHALRITGHNGFPVVDEPPITVTPELVGLVTRSHLLVLLNSKNFMKGQVKTSGSFVLRRFGAFDFAKPGSGKGLKIEDLDFTDEEMDMYVDLHPITNTSPYTVVETMSLAKAAILFRELGLRHLLVVPKTPDVRAHFLRPWNAYT